MAQYAPTKYNQDFKKPVIFGGLHHLQEIQDTRGSGLESWTLQQFLKQGPWSEDHALAVTASASSRSAVPSWDPVRTREALVTMMQEQAGNRVKAVYA